VGGDKKTGSNRKLRGAEMLPFFIINSSMKTFSQFLAEAPLMTKIGRKEKFSLETGKHLPKEKAGTKIASIDKDHALHHYKDDGQDIYVARHKKTGVVHSTIAGKRNAKTGTYTVHTADSTGQGPKVHKVYRKIMQSGHSSTLVGKSHSPGGQKIWQSLSKERGVSVHGWHHGKAHNIDTRDSEDTHVPDTEARSGALKNDPAGKTQYKMKLIASLHKRKTAK
jgi:hypothetical protein